MQMEHPPEWELAVASGTDEPGRCTFADRHYHRLDIRWRPLTYVPNLDLILTKYREHNKDTELADLTDLPPDWRGLRKQTPQGTLVHADRFFRNVRLLSEVTIIFPDRRDRELESQILASVQPEDPHSQTRLWDAMGLGVTIGRDFDLRRSTSNVGRVLWEFSTPAKSSPLLSVERIAMPDYWLKVPLRDWVVQELPSDHQTIRQEMAVYNTHRGEKLISTARVGTVAALRGVRKVRLDLAWQCPVENRLYRISFSQVTRDDEIPLPEHLAVRCCRVVPAQSASQVGG
jgi:hypothetical protein